MSGLIAAMSRWMSIAINRQRHLSLKIFRLLTVQQLHNSSSSWSQSVTPVLLFPCNGNVPDQAQHLELPERPDYGIETNRVPVPQEFPHVSGGLRLTSAFDQSPQPVQNQPTRFSSHHVAVF